MTRKEMQIGTDYFASVTLPLSQPEIVKKQFGAVRGSGRPFWRCWRVRGAGAEVTAGDNGKSSVVKIGRRYLNKHSKLSQIRLSLKTGNTGSREWALSGSGRYLGAGTSSLSFTPFSFSFPKVSNALICCHYCLLER